MYYFHLQDVITWNYLGHEIRFVCINGEYLAVLEDICNVLDLKSWHVKDRLPGYTQTKVMLETYRNMTNRYGSHNLGSSEVMNYSKSSFMKETTVVTETGIYFAIGNSRRIEAKQFMEWLGVMLSQYRQAVGLQQYEAIRLMEPQIQQRIQEPEVQKRFVQSMDDIQYDEERDCWVYVGTAPGGDVVIYDIDQNTGEILDNED